jgi:membrane dipeptidase
MERLGVILDVTHLADDAMTQAFGVFDGVVIASHSNCRALVPGQRQLRDTDILEIAGRGGVIGVAMDNWMLDPECGQTGTATVRRVASLEDVANHIDYVCQLTGSAKHSALGTDLDGGFGVEQSPRGLETIADLPRIGEVLTRRGYSTADVRSILWENWYDLVRRAWHASSLRSPAPTSAGPPAASNRSLSFPTFSENPS